MKQAIAMNLSLDESYVELIPARIFGFPSSLGTILDDPESQAPELQIVSVATPSFSCLARFRGDLFSYGEDLDFLCEGEDSAQTCGIQLHLESVSSTPVENRSPEPEMDTP